MIGTCVSCKYFYTTLKLATEGGGNAAGECRRYPPTPTIVPQPRGPLTITTFPSVQANQMCGEFETKLKIAN